MVFPRFRRDLVGCCLPIYGAIKSRSMLRARVTPSGGTQERGDEGHEEGDGSLKLNAKSQSPYGFLPSIVRAYKNPHALNESPIESHASSHRRRRVPAAVSGPTRPHSPRSFPGSVRPLPRPIFRLLHRPVQPLARRLPPPPTSLRHRQVLLPHPRHAPTATKPFALIHPRPRPRDEPGHHSIHPQRLREQLPHREFPRIQAGRRRAASPREEARLLDVRKVL